MIQIKVKEGQTFEFSNLNTVEMVVNIWNQRVEFFHFTASEAREIAAILVVEAEQLEINDKKPTHP